MTVCIAAMCENGKKIVVAADRMLTYPPPTSVEFETEESKIEQIAPTCTALFSGGTAYATQLLAKARKQIIATQITETGQIFEILKDDYIRLRMEKINEILINLWLGPDYMSASGKGVSLPLYLQPQPNMYQALVAQMQTYNLQLDMIIAGVDSSGAHVAVVTHPGTLLLLDKLGYTAIGSGGMHATISLSLRGQTSKNGLFETFYNVYMAKRASEAAPGVGQATDVAVIEPTEMRLCNQSVLDELSKLYSERTKSQSLDFKELKGVYDA